MARSLLQSLCATMVGSGLASTDLGFELLATTFTDPIPRTCHKAPKLPSSVHGSYYVAGPAQFEIDEYKLKGFFDGYGKINRFELGDGEICHTAKMMNTSILSVSQASGYPRGVIFEDSTPPRPSCLSKLREPMCEILATADNNWVNLLHVGDEALLLSDTTNMLRMDLETLGMSGVKPWLDDSSTLPGPTWIHGGHMGVIGSAHPLKRPGTNTWVAMLVEMPLVPTSTHLTSGYVDIYTFDGSHSKPQHRNLLASVQMDNVQHMHSFGVTPNYVVLPMNLKVNMFNPLNPLLIDKMETNWNGIYLVNSQGQSTKFDTDYHFSHVHFVNTFENGTGVVADVGIHKENIFSHNPLMDIDQFLNQSSRDAWRDRGSVHRFHFHTSGPLAGKTTDEFLDTGVTDISIDFPKVNPAFVGLPYCVYYALQFRHNGENFGSMAIMKHNVCTGDVTFWSRPNTYPGEPNFVASGASGTEDDGIVVFIALDGNKRTSIFVTLDARTMRELDVVELSGGHIPFTAHGTFVPTSTSQDQAIIV